MAKSMRCKSKKRLRSIKREIAEKQPFYTDKEAAKLAVQAAALAAPKLPVPARKSDDNVIMDVTTSAAITDTNMDVDMGEGNRMMQFLKPSSRKIGKNMKKKIKIAKKKNRGKGKIRRKNI